MFRVWGSRTSGASSGSASPGSGGTSSPGVASPGLASLDGGEARLSVVPRGGHECSIVRLTISARLGGETPPVPFALPSHGQLGVPWLYGQSSSGVWVHGVSPVPSVGRGAGLCCWTGPRESFPQGLCGFTLLARGLLHWFFRCLLTTGGYTPGCPGGVLPTGAVRGDSGGFSFPTRLRPPTDGAVCWVGEGARMARAQRGHTNRGGILLRKIVPLGEPWPSKDRECLVDGGLELELICITPL